MAEWSKAAVLKTAEGNTFVGSNPTPSANISIEYLRPAWRINFKKDGASWLRHSGGRLRRLKATSTNIQFAIFNFKFSAYGGYGEMAELAEGARLLSE